MTTPVRGFLWLLSDEETPSDAIRRPVLRLEHPAHLRLARNDEVTEDLDPVEQVGEGTALLERMQALFDTDGSSRHREDADVWRRMAATVILAIGVGIVVALGAGVAFSGL